MLLRSRLGSLALLILLLMSNVSVGSMTTQPLEQSEVFTPSQTSWLSGWQYRKSHTITGSVGAGTDYQVRINVHRTTGIDSGEDVFVDTKCKSDFGDIRFTDADGTTVLDYWMEVSTLTEATFWIEVMDNLDSEQSIFIYYANDAATDESDGDDTFLFFDHFEGSSLDLTKWSIENPDGTATISDSILTLSGNNGDFRIAIKSVVSAFNPASIRFRGMLEATQTTPQWNHIAWSHHVWGPGTYQRAGIRSKYGDHQTYVANDNGDIGDTALDAQYFDAFHTFDVHRLSDSCKLYSDDTFVTSGSNLPDDTSVPVVLYCRDNDYTLQCDWIFMRKIIDNEPTHSSWGSEDAPIPRTVTWHHDCSNTTSFVSDPNPTPWPYSHGVLVNDGVDLLSDGSSIFSSSIPYEGEGAGVRHGATYFFKLATPLQLDGLDLEVSFTHIGSANRMGSVIVNLCDASNLSTYYVAGYDGWYSSQIRESKGYLNSSEFLFYDSTDSSPSGEWTGSIRIYHNRTTGHVADSDSSGPEVLLSHGEFEPWRDIHYIALTFFVSADYTYETWKINDILIKGTPVPDEPSTTTTSTSTTTTTTGTQTPPPSPPDMMIFVIIGLGGGGIAIIAIVVIFLRRRPIGGGSADTPYNW
ncbi:MAG: DUF2341 domain-containing protein [Candidatus Thorarchaeota archaeon]